MVARISDAIQSAGGCILDFRFFSNLALFIDAEVATARVGALITALVQTELRLDSRSVAIAKEFAVVDAGVEERREMSPVHLFVTFIHNDPDLRIPVPAIPG